MATNDPSATPIERIGAESAKKNRSKKKKKIKKMMRSETKKKKKKKKKKTPNGNFGVARSIARHQKQKKKAKKRKKKEKEKNRPRGSAPVSQRWRHTHTHTYTPTHLHTHTLDVKNVTTPTEFRFPSAIDTQSQPRESSWLNVGSIKCLPSFALEMAFAAFAKSVQTRFYRVLLGFMKTRWTRERV